MPLSHRLPNQSERRLMQCRDAGQYRDYEKFLVAAIRDVVSELRLIDLADLVACVGSRNMALLDSLAESAIELYFYSGTLAFGNSAAVSVSWNGQVSVCLDFEFKYDGVTIYFTLHMLPLSAAIQINYISYAADMLGASHGDKLARTALLLTAARRRPIDNRLAWWRAQKIGERAAQVVPHVDIVQYDTAGDSVFPSQFLCKLGTREQE
jgi:hypothetical protein